MFGCLASLQIIVSFLNYVNLGQGSIASQVNVFSGLGRDLNPSLPGPANYGGFTALGSGSATLPGTKTKTDT